MIYERAGFLMHSGGMAGFNHLRLRTDGARKMLAITLVMVSAVMT